ncbi:hypothetical protein [Aliiruegeria sabulilitoris]|uniref:hypothetical protein n=1 Tax=Aliiruegeria sabulilitoris TaxID=1510458 RepID=UPI0012E396DA|nr:hypothetical protein [Aliiruegeria sabulilitoris]NDR57405.1 hypothetical protein [Pseudoruegeria sp. M32A2M]
MGLPNVYREIEKNEHLCQGDILFPSRMRERLAGHQDYYANAPHFYRYVVLTQTCDLAREGDRSNFIFLSVARKLSEALGPKDLESKKIAEGKTQNLLKELLMFQYNKRGFFYLPQDESQGVDEPLVVDLRVILSLHKSHHDKLVLARCGGLNDLFAAQLGQLTAQMFNRIAIPDVDAGEANFEAAKLAKSARTKHAERFDALFAASSHKKCSVLECGKRAETFRWLNVKSLDGEGEEEVILCFEHARQLDAGTFVGELTLKD